MSRLFVHTNDPYELIYASLNRVREIFHQEGRIGDSNAKLEETVKLLAMHFSHSQALIDDADYGLLCRRETFSVSRLNELFAKTANTSLFKDENSEPIFGRHPSTAFDIMDENVAYELFQATKLTLFEQSFNKDTIDVLNEAFGHYVRDNFRSHTEDAQYMTPPEVVSFMIELAGSEIFGGNYSTQSKNFVMMDPSCGVGSFITGWRKKYDSYKGVRSLPPMIGIGQDKVERMARLSRVNMVLSGHSEDKIFIGNTAYDDSKLTEYNGKVDLILTNPPFGAKFPLADIRLKSRKSAHIFANCDISNKFIDSEILFIDRYLSLLKPNGICLAVVPDRIISAKGICAYLRQKLACEAQILAVVELPPVAFAQAGTRTKTAVLVFKKTKHDVQVPSQIFFGEAEDLGFEVFKRKGVPVKRLEGHNQLSDILQAYRASEDIDYDVNGRRLTAIWRSINPRRVEAWTPRQFRVKRSEAALNTQMRPLKEVVEARQKRRPEPFAKGKRFISVLHVIGEGILDMAGLYSYEPITPGIPVYPGEVIISRLNPRIPRVLVVPDIGEPMLCSSEFEILRPRNNVSPFAIAFLLMNECVQEQILSLTAGTSASHSRIKPAKLYEINLPWPNKDGAQAFDIAVGRYQKSNEALIHALSEIHSMRSGILKPKLH